MTRDPNPVAPKTHTSRWRHACGRWGGGAALKGGDDGLLLGWQGGQMLRYGGDGHLITVAATRSGKGVGAIMPNLLSYPGSVVVTDPKGENYYVTARYRREELGQEVTPIFISSINALQTAWGESVTMKAIRTRLGPSST